MKYLVIAIWASSVVELGLPILLSEVGISAFVGLSLLFILLMISAGLFGCGFSYRRCLGGESLYFLMALAGYQVYSLASALWAKDVALGSFSALQGIWYFSVFSLSWCYLSRLTLNESEDAFKKIGLVIIGCFLVLTVISYVRGYGWGVFEERNRFSPALFKDYNMYVQCVLIGYSLLMVRGNEAFPGWKKTIFYLFGILFIIVLGVVSGSRRSIVIYGPIFIFVFVFLMFYKRPARGVVLMVIVSVLSAVLLIGLLSIDRSYHKDDTSEVLLDLGNRMERGLGFITGEYDVTSDRVQKWNNSVELLSEFEITEIFFGIGEKGYQSDNRFIREGGGPDSPHNFLLVDIIEGGVIKLVITFSLFFWLMYFCYRSLCFPFWKSVIIISNLLVYIASVSISGEGLVHSRIIYLIILFSMVFLSIYRGRSFEVK